MTRPLAAAFAVALIAAVTTPEAAQAQRRGKSAAELAAEIAGLSEKVAALEQATVQLPTLAQAAEELGERLALLQQELEKLGREQKSIPDAVAALDELSLRVRAVEKEVALLRTQVAGIEQPAVGAGGGGVTHDRGFNWRTADGRYSLALDGVLQARYQLLLNEDFDDLSEHGFRMERVRLGASGILGSTDLSYRMLFSLTSASPALDCYADYAFRDELVLRVGQFKTPFTRANLTYGEDLAFPERTRTLEHLRYDRDIGVGLHGRLADDRLDYFVGVLNGAGANQVNDNLDVAAVARAEVLVTGERFGHSYGDVYGTAVPSLVVGAGAVHDLVRVPLVVETGGAGADIPLVQDVDGDGEPDNVRVISASADAAFRYRGLEVDFEWMLRHEQWGTILQGNPALDPVLHYDTSSRKNRNYMAFSGQATYMALPKRLMVGARAAHTRLPFLGVGGRPSVLPHPDCGDRCDSLRLFELDGLVQLYSDRGERMLGLQYSFFNYNAIDAGAPAADKEHRFLLEAQTTL